jgi:hypothetical protein
LTECSDLSEAEAEETEAVKTAVAMEAIKTAVAVTAMIDAAAAMTVNVAAVT